jgi:hypothetical protein
MKIIIKITLQIIIIDKVVISSTCMEMNFIHINSNIPLHPLYIFNKRTAHFAYNGSINVSNPFIKICPNKNLIRPNKISNLSEQITNLSEQITNSSEQNLQFVRTNNLFVRTNF